MLPSSTTTDSPASSSRSLSRIGSVQRNWSEETPTLSTSGSTPTPSQETVISWPSSPELVKPVVAAPKKLSRMDAIRAALMEDPTTEVPPPAAPIASASSSSKRPSPSEDDGAQQPRKKRTLPWTTAHVDLKESRRERLASVPLKEVYPLAPPGQAPKVAPDPASSSSSSSPKFTAVLAASSAINIKQRVLLSVEQQQILQLVQGGKNVFFTGSAGTGKSVLLREIITTLRKKYSKAPDAVAITASTGIAACNIGGVTLHSFGGIGLGIESAEHLATKVKKNRKASTRWLRTQVLIIDEVSMVDGDLLDKLAKIATILRKNTKPFGGIQLIITGDFFQLPPVVKGGPTRFAFEAQMWKDCIDRTFNLTKVFRQKDQEFVDMLNEMRFGRLSSKSIAKFRSLSRDIVYTNGMEPTELFPRREDVDRANHTRLQSLHGETHTFFAHDGGTITDANQRDKLLSNLLSPSQLKLRKDCQVMLIKNTDDTLVNGTMGKVIDFLDPQQYARSLGGAVEEDKKGKKAADKGGVTRYPLVRFQIQGSPGSTRDVLVQPESWKIELPNGEIQASRTQLPLILAWAMSIHKSQGQTLERVKVDLGRVFEKGQAYVALSRATSLEGLQVLHFEPAKVQAHPKVAKWSETLESVA